MYKGPKDQSSVQKMQAFKDSYNDKTQKELDTFRFVIFLKIYVANIICHFSLFSKPLKKVDHEFEPVVLNTIASSN